VLESFETGLDSNVRSSPGLVSCAILLGLRFVYLKLSLLPPWIFAAVSCWLTSTTRRTLGASVTTGLRHGALTSYSAPRARRRQSTRSRNTSDQVPVACFFAEDHHEHLFRLQPQRLCHQRGVFRHFSVDLPPGPHIIIVTTALDTRHLHHSTVCDSRFLAYSDGIARLDRCSLIA